jgi:hypothetical protein
MTTRMNKELREEILTNVLNATDLNERETELKQRIKKTVRGIVIQDLPKGFAALTQVHPKEWFASTSSLYFGGEKDLIPLSLAKESAYCYPAIILDDPVPTPCNFQWDVSLHKEELLPLAEEAQQLTDERNALSAEIRAFLLSCRTTDQVVKRMPELGRHVPKTSYPVPSVVPSNLLSSLTKMGFDRTASA